MRFRVLTVLAAAVMLAGASQAALATTSFSGGVCSIVDAKLVAELGFTAKCSEAGPVRSRLVTFTAARWTIRRPPAVYRSFSVELWRSGTALFKSRFEQAESRGKRLEIGEWARELVSTSSVAIYVWSRGQGVSFVLDDSRKGRRAGIVELIARRTVGKL